MTAGRPRIVILDDDEIFASLLSEALADACEVALGRNGLEGITLCLDSHTDLIVTDIGMPELDGIQMVQALNADPRLCAIPVLVVTATHFSRQNKTDLTRYAQVRNIIDKSSPLDSIVREIRDILAQPGQRPA